jgi:tetratricopeptide (TPR) repeat protein
MSKQLVAAAIALVLLTGCAKAPTPAAPAATTAATAAVATGDSQTLCLADPGGESATDTRVRAAQTAARQNSAQSARWVAAGREWVRKARLSADPGFYLNVDGCTNEALSVEPGAVAALELRGLVLMNDHKFEAARALASEIIAREPESVTALGTLSDALLELGRYDESARAVQRQADLRPGMAASARGSYLRWLKGDTRTAKLLIRDALIGRDPADPEPAAWVLCEAAILYWHEGDYAGADALYAQALVWLPDFAAALVGRGRVALAQARADQAVSFLQRAQARRPLVETAWLLGDALAARGDAEGAERAYAEAVRQGQRGDRFTLAQFYANKNRDHGAALEFLQQDRRNRGGVYLDDAYAWALFRAGRLTEARDASRDALRLGTKDARLLYHGGAIRIAAGEVQAGRKLVAQALALNPHFDPSGAAEARALLADSSFKLAAK